jgi:hypothetical protein
MALLTFVCGCGGANAMGPAAPARAVGDPVQFSFGTVEGSEVTSDTTRGRTTALLFVTTYDLPSQGEARLLSDVLRQHRPRANGAIVMLEPPHSAPLAQVWRDAIGLDLPVAMAGPQLLAGESELGRVNGVPTLIVLDRRGRVVVRREGSVSRAEIVQCLKLADAA